MEDIEDIKEDDEETQRMVLTFNKHLEEKIMAKYMQKGKKMTKEDYERALTLVTVPEM